MAYKTLQCSNTTVRNVNFALIYLPGKIYVIFNLYWPWKSIVYTCDHKFALELNSKDKQFNIYRISLVYDKIKII